LKPEEIIQHLRRGIDHGITITPAEAEGLVELIDKLEADFVRVHGYFLEAAQDNVKIIQEATKIREESEKAKAEIKRLKPIMRNYRLLLGDAFVSISTVRDASRIQSLSREIEQALGIPRGKGPFEWVGNVAEPTYDLDEPTLKQEVK